MMTFKATKVDGSSHLETRSWFTARADGRWLAVTAGHVVQGLRGYAKAGWQLSNFELEDKMAGHDFSLSSVPIFFDPETCLAVDEPWGDYAAWELDPLTVRCLERGGIEPMAEDSWSNGPLQQYEHLLLVGAPSETYRQLSPTEHTVSPTIIPLNMTAVRDPHQHPNIRNATLVQMQNPDGASVSDIDGMSGGPIFGFRTIDSEMRYFLVGVQSGWFKPRREVTFYLAAPFLELIRKHFLKLQDLPL